MIETRGKRESVKSVLGVRYDDDDDDYIPESSRSRDSQSDSVYCHRKDTFFVGVVLPVYQRYIQDVLSPVNKAEKRKNEC